MRLHPHQLKVKRRTLWLLKTYGLAYIAGEVRTGKTLAAIHAADSFLHGNGNVLVLTKKKAIRSIESDYKASGVSIEVTVISMDSIHKVDWDPDLIILDEAHSFGSFPKPNRRARTFKKMFEGIPVIFLSGTPSPESFSQLFHQLWITGKGPWAKYHRIRGFYRWAKTYVNVVQEFIGLGRPINNYSDAKPAVMKEFKKYCVFMTQAEAGFKGKVIERIYTVKFPDSCLRVLKEVKKHRVSVGGIMVADTGAKLMSYCHQLSSGTYIDINKKRRVISKFKAKFINKKFKGKIAIFYVYVAEGDMLKKVFPNWTDSPEVFNASKKKTFIGQIVSVREGTNLSTADDLIYINIPYSAVSYWQGRARSQTRSGGNKRVNWIFSDTGIEQEIYETVQQKKNFTLDHFKIWQNSSPLLKRK